MFPAAVLLSSSVVSLTCTFGNSTQQFATHRYSSGLKSFINSFFNPGLKTGVKKKKVCMGFSTE